MKPLCVSLPSKHNRITYRQSWQNRYPGSIFREGRYYKSTSRRLCTPGTPLVNLQDQSSIKISFTLPERYLPLITSGTPIKFSTGLSEEQYSASITATEPGLDAKDRSLQVQAIASNSGGKFRPGESVKVYFSTEKKGTKGVMIPTEALMPGEKGYNAFVIKGGIAKPTPVVISNRTETEAIITSGIKSGDSIVISNMLRVGDGTPVQAVVKITHLNLQHYEYIIFKHKNQF